MDPRENHSNEYFLLYTINIIRQVFIDYILLIFNLLFLYFIAYVF